jgi:iron complex outermembrane receptor protein
MSELINKNDNRATIRWKLLTTASAVSLMASAYGAQAGEPSIWINLGWHFDRIGGQDELYIPPLAQELTQAPFNDLINAERHIMYAYGLDGSVSLRPEDSHWVISASVKYGRAHGARSVHQTMATVPPYVHTSIPAVPRSYAFHLTTPNLPHGYVRGSNSEKHIIADFQAGRDVGLGLFGQGGESVLSAGVRIAQFKSASSAVIFGDPDMTPYYFHTTRIVNVRVNGVRQPEPKFIVGTGHTFHILGAAEEASRDFHGIGPTLSWAASAPVAGNLENGEIALDFGLNAAILFGRQTVRGTHHETGEHERVAAFYTKYHSSYHRHATITRSRRVTVPNLGGFAGISYRYSDAKLSLGYRGDFFFGAMDGGMDARKSETRSFMGPFASISIGLGD